MSSTEVYSCKPGQQLKEGKLDYAPHIETKEQAEADAKRRCAADPTLAKVAYYKVKEDGNFRILFTYTNPKPSAAKPVQRRPVSDPLPKARPAVKKPEPPKRFLDRIKDIFK